MTDANRLLRLTAEAQRLIERVHRLKPLGAVLWSGGKDSMTLLHLMRPMGIELPLIFFREPWQPFKYEFHDGIIRRWGLQVISWHPAGVAFQQTGDEFELQNAYQLGPIQLTCPTGIVPPADGLPWTCAVDMALRPTQERLDVFPFFQALWVGHKRSDRDVVLGGDAGTRVHAVNRPDGVMSVFPLRDWTDEDVWAYIEANDVPYDEARYEKHGGVWRERPGRRHNADYVHACTACIDRRADAPRFVHCPKIEAMVENSVEHVPWVEPQKLSYMQDAA